MKQALETLLCQTFDDYEIVIHDDHSSDDTCDAILNYFHDNNIGPSNKGTAKRIRLYRAFENGGIVTNRLRAFSHCEGKWLIQTDGDDFSPNDRLEKTKAIFDSLDHEPMLVSTNRWEWEEGVPYEEVESNCFIPCQKNEWVKLIDIVDQPRMPNGSSGFIVHKKVFEAFYGSIPQTRIIADDPVLAKRALLLGDVYISEVPLYYCRVSANSASGGGVSGKKWIYDRYNRWDLLLQDIAHISDDHNVPGDIQRRVEKWKKRMLLDAKLIDCSNLVWPFLWIKMVFISPMEAKYALKKRIKLILKGDVNASMRKRG